jgi:hypothetical protein
MSCRCNIFWFIRSGDPVLMFDFGSGGRGRTCSWCLVDLRKRRKREVMERQEAVFRFIQ